jgi:hypothetical protein
MSGIYEYNNNNRYDRSRLIYNNNKGIGFWYDHIKQEMAEEHADQHVVAVLWNIIHTLSYRHQFSFSLPHSSLPFEEPVKAFRLSTDGWLYSIYLHDAAGRDRFKACSLFRRKVPLSVFVLPITMFESRVKSVGNRFGSNNHQHRLYFLINHLFLRRLFLPQDTF